MPAGGTRETTVVCDNGTGFVKCGYAGDNFPRAKFPCMVGRPLLRYEEEISSSELKDIMVGDDCAAHRNNLEVTYPVTNGERFPRGAARGPCSRRRAQAL